jgi:DNA-binding NarL/FixJ family response regulator
MRAGTVLLYEDDPITCDVLVDTLTRDGHDVRVFESLQQVMTAADRMPRSLALMDFWGTSYRRLAHHEGQQVVRLARAVPTVLLTGRPWANEQLVAELGCRAFVPKPFRPSQVAEVVAATMADVSSAAAGEHARPLEVGSADAAAAADSAVRAHDAITRRQREVAVLIARGLSNAEIAQQLVLTPGTVANHVEAILRRLALRSRTSIAVWAVEQGLYRSVREAPDVGPTPASRCPTCGSPRLC